MSKMKHFLIVMKTPHYKFVMAVSALQNLCGRSNVEINDRAHLKLWNYEIISHQKVSFFYNISNF